MHDAERDGIEEIQVAVVEPGVAPEELLQSITSALRGLQIGLFRVLVLSHIPRTATGKIERGGCAAP